VRLSLVIVCYGEDISPLLDRVAEQKREGDEVFVVDNRSSNGGTPSARGRDDVVDRLIEPEGNLHYAQGCNFGAAAATGAAILILNPDALPQPGFLDAMRAPPGEWDAWTAVLTLPDGVHINNGGGAVHFLGFAWSGLYGQTVDALPEGPAPVGFLSGGCLAVRREAWNALGGYPAHYGVYHEDADLSLRLRLEGRPFGLLPDARVAHDYDFAKSLGKWRNIERNRWRTVVRTYPTPLLLAVLPLLIAVEPALLAVGMRRGWLWPKLRSYLDLLLWLPSGIAERRAVQARRRVTPREFARGLVTDLDSPFFGGVGQSALLRRAFRAYWRVIEACLPD
jgi:N-acetylglucosaminyl-diphospho-decaprenol L-rhamnosyltransferase